MNKSMFKLIHLPMLMLIYGCGGKPPEKALPVATVSIPLEKEVVNWDEYPGRLQSPQTVSVAARVGGIINSAPFQEGALVQKGDVLFVIDDRPFAADFASKEAEVKRADAALAQTDAQFKRYEQLKGTKAISGEAYDQALAAVLSARANLGVAKAAVDISRLNLEWTKVTAPVSGRISKKFVTEGNLVNGGAGAPTELTTITSIDPVYAYITVSERAFLNYRDIAEKEKAEGRDKMQCSVQLENENTFSHVGYVDFVDNQVDPATGTIATRCVLANSSGKLTPGLYARMRLQASNKYVALLIPDSSVSTDQNSKFVSVVGKDGIVQIKHVKLGTLFGKLRAVVEGLDHEDKVIVTGLQQLRPGTKVTLNEIKSNEDPAVAASQQAVKAGPA